MSTLTHLKAVQSSNRYQTPSGNGTNNFSRTHQSPQRASMLFPGTNTTSSNVAHWKKGVISIIRSQYPTLDERIKIMTSKVVDGAAAMKIYDDSDYKLETLTLQQEQTLGKLELDNKMNDNKRKRTLNSYLAEQRVQGAFQIFSYISTESKAQIDTWIRTHTTHWYIANKFSSITDVYNDGTAADVLNLVDFSHAEPTTGVPILSDLAALRAYLTCKQNEDETPAAFSERLDELGDKIPAKYAIKNDHTLAAAIMYQGSSDAYNPAKSFILNNVNENIASFPSNLGAMVNTFSRFTVTSATMNTGQPVTLQSTLNEYVDNIEEDDFAEQDFDGKNDVESVDSQMNSMDDNDNDVADDD